VEVADRITQRTTPLTLTVALVWRVASDPLCGRRHSGRRHSRHTGAAMLERLIDHCRERGDVIG
jgi:hypothetical protein